MPRRFAALAILLLLALVAALLLRKRLPAETAETEPEPREKPVAVVASDPEPAPGSGLRKEPAAGAEEPLESKASIRGRVTDAITGAPVTGARIIATPWDSEVKGAAVFAVSGASDVDGRYILKVAPNAYRMKVYAEGYVPLQVDREIQEELAGRGDGTSCQVLVPEGGEATFDAALTSGVMLTCLVTDEGGGPIEGAVISVEVHTLRHGREGTGIWLEDETGYLAETDAQGRVRLGAFLPRGTLEIRARCAGYAGKVETVDLSAGAQEARIILKRARTASGVVVDAQGNPIPGAHLLLEDPDAWEPRYGAADAKGRFEFADLPEHCTHVSAWAPGFGLAGVRFGDAIATDLRIVLPAGGDVRGVVVDETGTPLPGVEVVVSLLRRRGADEGTLIFQVEEPSGWSFSGHELGGELPDAVQAPRTVTNELGEFTLKGACPAEGFSVHLAIKKEEYGLCWVVATPREAVRVTLVKGGKDVDETQDDEPDEESDD